MFIYFLFSSFLSLPKTLKIMPLNMTSKRATTVCISIYGIDVCCRQSIFFFFLFCSISTLRGKHLQRRQTDKRRKSSCCRKSLRWFLFFSSIHIVYVYRIYAYIRMYVKFKARQKQRAVKEKNNTVILLVLITNSDNLWQV